MQSHSVLKLRLTFEKHGYKRDNALYHLYGGSMHIDEQKPVVKFELTDNLKFNLSYDSSLLDDHLINFESVPEEKRKGQPLRMLCASALSCYVGTIYLELSARKAEIRHLKGNAVPVISLDKDGLNRLDTIAIEIDVDVPEKDSEILDEVLKLLNTQGCPISHHLSHPIEIKSKINRIN